MRNRLKASICIPVYNSGQFLRECLESALMQTFSDYEVVVSVDPGSTDNTEEILRDFSDDRLRVIRPPQHLGAGENFRFNIAASRGEYFNFRGANDNLFPEFLESQIEILSRHPNVTFVHSASEIIDENSNVIGLSKSIHRSFVRPGREELRRYIFEPKAHGDTYLVRRSAYDAVGGLGPRVFFVDWEISLRLLCYGDVAYNEKVLNQNRSYEDEYRRSKRKLEFLNIKPDFFDYYRKYIVARYPEFKELFYKARRKAALRSINAFVSFDEEMKREARNCVLNISPSWLVHTKLALYDRLGLGLLWHWANNTKLHIKSLVKHLMYPKGVL